jgi:hypothetical protein
MSPLISTLIATALSLVLGPIAAVAATMGLAKATGRLDRLVDQQGRTGWLFAFAVGSRPWEFLVGLIRGLALLLVVRLLAAALNPSTMWPLVASAALPMLSWEVWRLRFHARFWPLAASTGVQSHNLAPVDAQRALANALEGGRRREGLMRVALLGDVAGIMLGSLLLFVQ